MLRRTWSRLVATMIKRKDCQMTPEEGNRVLWIATAASALAAWVVVGRAGSATALRLGNTPHGYACRL